MWKKVKLESSCQQSEVMKRCFRNHSNTRSKFGPPHWQNRISNIRSILPTHCFSNQIHERVSAIQSTYRWRNLVQATNILQTCLRSQRVLRYGKNARLALLQTQLDTPSLVFDNRCPSTKKKQLFELDRPAKLNNKS